MGTCYSKNTVGAGTSESKVPKQRHRDSKNKEKWSEEDLASERSPLKLNEKDFGKLDVSVTDSANSVASQSSTPGIVCKQLNEKFAGSGVIPSDSGIESIDNVQVDAGELANSKQESDDLSKQHLIIDHYQTHGNSLSAYGNCLSDPKGAEKLNFNSQYETHGTQQKRSSSTIFSIQNDPPGKKYAENSTVTRRDMMTSGSCNGIEVSELKSDSSNKIKSYQVSKQAIDLDMASILLPTQEGSTPSVSYICHDKNSNNIAPLAEFDSTETNLNDSTFHVNQKRQSLLSEILDITESLCKCDFYSSEYCNRDHGLNASVTEVISNAFSSETGANGQFHDSSQYINHPSVSFIHHKSETPSNSSNSSHKLGSPSKNGSSLPKNVSFATHEEINDETFMSATSVPVKKALLKSRVAYNSPLKSVMLESYKTASELVLSKRQKDFHKRSASLGSVRGLMSDSSSDAPDCGTEEDVESLDMDSISRVTSLSYSSIRQLVESTDDLLSFHYAGQPVTVDGVDCVVIPTVAYRQMQADLATLKQQLLYLSSLMQGTEDLEQK